MKLPVSGSLDLVRTAVTIVSLPSFPFFIVTIQMSTRPACTAGMTKDSECRLLTLHIESAFARTFDANQICSRPTPGR